MPSFGLGLYQADANERTVKVVKTAIDLGYRLLDTAQLYGNEIQTGQGIRASQIPREHIFITTKLYTTTGGRRQVLQSFQQSLNNLMVNYIDLYLIHA
ncbi:unnamed protein product, partial [Didymodactylos carnosus]